MTSSLNYLFIDTECEVQQLLRFMKSEVEKTIFHALKHITSLMNETIHMSLIHFKFIPRINYVHNLRYL